MTPLMYEVPSDPTITRVTITAESVKEHVSPPLSTIPTAPSGPVLAVPLSMRSRGRIPQGKCLLNSN